MRMIRTQIQLDDSVSVRVKQAAAREHISMSEMIRRAIDFFMTSSSGAAVDNRYDRAVSAAGRFSSGRSDMSSSHDAHFAEVSEK